MCCGEVRLVAPLAIGLAVGSGGCALRLDSIPVEPTEDALPLAVGCGLLAEGDSPIVAVRGRARRLRLPDHAEPVWLVDGVIMGEPQPPASALIRGDIAADGCSAAEVSATAALAATSPGAAVAPLDVVLPADSSSTAAPSSWLYFVASEPFAPPRGYGIAPYDEALGRFVAGEELLWTGDRPAFGSAALQLDGQAWVWGCRPARFLEADCWLARAPAAEIDDASRYEYARGGGSWTHLVDESWPLLEAGSTVSLAYLPERDRFLMAFIRPLGSSIVLRTGLAPDGPWSEAVAAARCALPPGDEEAFCHDVTLHPGLASAGSDSIMVSYAVSTFLDGALQADPVAYRTILAPVKIPQQLP